MSVLDRYKKSGGFVQLLTLLETCGQAKREKFLQMILEESPYWHEALKKRMLSLDMVLEWPIEFLTEITSRVQPITLTAISKGIPEEQTKKLFQGLSHSSFAKIREISENKSFTAMEISSSIEKFLGETRTCIQTGIIKLDKFAPHLSTPDDIEEQLSKKSSAAAASASSTAGLSATPMAGSAGGNSPMPPPANEDPSGLRKINFQLQQELQQLRAENSMLREKLERIRKIA